MKGIKIIFYVFGGFALLSVVVVLLTLLAQGAIIDLKYPEWTKFRNDMINAYPEIDRYPIQMWAQNIVLCTI